MNSKTLFSLGFCQGEVLGADRRANTKRPDMVLAKNHAATAARHVEEPAAGRAVERQIGNRVSGVVTRRLATTDATSDRVGARGAKLLNGFRRTPLAGRPTASLPVRPHRTRTARPEPASVSSVQGPAHGRWVRCERPEHSPAYLPAQALSWMSTVRMWLLIQSLAATWSDLSSSGFGPSAR